MSLLTFPKETFVHVFKPKTPKISRSLIVFIASAQLCFGFNLGFVKKMGDKYKMACQVFSVTIGLVFLGYLVYGLTFDLIGIIYVVQYFFTLLILGTSGYTLYEFLLDMMCIKTDVEEDVITENIGTITWIYVFFIFCLKFAIGFVYHWILDDPRVFVKRLLFLIPVLALDSIPIAIFLIYYHVYAKLKQLKLGFQNYKTGVVEVQNTYKAVIDLLDKMRSTADNLTVLGFVADCPKWIVTIWGCLLLLKTSESKTVLFCSSAYALHLTLQMCVSAACAEIAQAQSDALHVLAHERLIDERDEALAASLTRLARYVSARPPRRRPWRALPPGLRLPAATLSMCTTYLVVLIQLTHLYD